MKSKKIIQKQTFIYNIKKNIMKAILIGLSIIGATTFTACNNGNKSSEKKDISNMDKDTTQKAATTDEKEIKSVSVTFTNIDAKAASSLKEIVDHYLHLKTALANDDSKEATIGSKMMLEAISKVDKSYFAPDQKKVYDDNEGKLKAHAGLISKANDIEEQRSHFSMASENLYALVKAFGGGRTLYHDHCPMANNNKGAMWLSESKEIKNPYMGSRMPTCGSVEEKIQ